MPSTYMVSAQTLTTLRDRVEQFLADTTNLKFVTGLIDDAIRLAPGEYSTWRPLEDVATLLMTARQTELGSDFAGLFRVLRVQYPYTAAAPEYPLTLPEWELVKDAGVFALMLTDVPAPAGTKYARVWFVKGHTLSGLDSATVTTFPPSIDWLLELGAAGHALFSRAIALSEDVNFDTTATPNLLVAASRLVKEFRFQLRVMAG